MALREKSNQLTERVAYRNMVSILRDALGFVCMWQNYDFPRGEHFLAIFSKTVYGQEWG
jgi:hypothetical protein